MIVKKIRHLLLSRLVKHSFVFVITDVINKSIPFLLLPILTIYLTPAEYGSIASFNSIFAVLCVFVGLSVQGAVGVNYFKQSKKELSEFIGNVFIVLFISTTITLLIVFALRYQLEELLQFPWKWIIIAVFTAFGFFIVSINLTLWIVEQKPKNYGIFNILDSLLKVGLSVWFVIVLTMGWEGRIGAIFIVTISMAIISTYMLWRRGYLKIVCKKVYVKDALMFGIPLVPHQLGSWIRKGAVILLLVSLVGQAETGLYDVGFKFASIMVILTMAINKAYQPYLFKKLKGEPQESEKRRMVKYTYLYFISLIIIAGLITILSPLLISCFLNNTFYESYKYIGYLTFSAAFQGMYFMVGSYIMYEKKTKYLAYVTFIVSIIHISLAFFFINRFGAIGAAQASLVGFFLSFVFVWFYSNKVYRMPWLSIFKRQ